LPQQLLKFVHLVKITWISATGRLLLVATLVAKLETPLIQRVPLTVSLPNVLLDTATVLPSSVLTWGAFLASVVAVKVLLIASKFSLPEIRISLLAFNLATTFLPQFHLL